MEPMDLSKFVEEAKKYVTDEKRYHPKNHNKIKPFIKIDTFLQTGLSEQELELVTAQLTLLKQIIVKKETKKLEKPEDPSDLFDDSDDLDDFVDLGEREEYKEYAKCKDDNSDFLQRQIEDSCFILFINYLLMLEINKEAILGIADSDILYLIVDVMRNVSYGKFDEAIRKLLYPAFIDVINTTIAEDKGSIDDIHGTINTLTDRIIADDQPFKEEQLDAYMNNFLLTKAYNTLCIPNNIVGERRMQIEIIVNKISILGAIEAVNKKTSSYGYTTRINTRKEVMSFYDYEMSDKAKAMINIAFYRKLKDEKVMPFQSANLRLILLILGRMMDINAMDQEQLFALVKKLEEEDVPQSEYLTFISNGKSFK